MANHLRTELVLDARWRSASGGRTASSITATRAAKADSTDRRNKIYLCWPNRATPETDPALPHRDTRRVHFDRRVSPEARDLASLFSTMLVAHLDKRSAVLSLVQDEPALRAGAASGILDKTCARRSAGGRSAPRNGPLSLTKECNLDFGSGEATSEAMVTSQHGQFRTSLDMADISNWSRPKRWFGKYMYLWRAKP